MRQLRIKIFKEFVELARKSDSYKYLRDDVARVNKLGRSQLETFYRVTFDLTPNIDIYEHSIQGE